MFESMSLLSLQQYWWAIVSLLGALLVFLMFVQGGQTLLSTIAKNETELTLLVNALGKKWEFTFTTLVTFGGAMFASFPLFYSTSFGGAYWVWIIILFCFIIQAVSYEFRSKPNNFLGKKTYDIFLFINGSIGIILIGAAVGTFFSGSAFSVNDYNLSKWETPYRGLEAALNTFNVLLGLSVFFLARVLGLLYFINHIKNDEIFTRSIKHLKINAVLFLILFLTFLVLLLTKNGFAYDAASKHVYYEPYKYLNNLLAMPYFLILFLVGVLLVLWGLFISIFKKSTKGIWFSGIGTVLTVFVLFIIAGFNNTSFYPSTFDLQSSLTIENSSSSHYTLSAMSYVSLLVPFVVAYIYFAWKAIDKKKIDATSLKDEEHLY